MALLLYPDEIECRIIWAFVCCAFYLFVCLVLVMTPEYDAFWYICVS